MVNISRLHPYHVCTFTVPFTYSHTVYSHTHMHTYILFPIFSPVFEGVSPVHVSFRARRTGLRQRDFAPRGCLLITAISRSQCSLDPIGLAEHPFPFVLVFTLIRLKEPIRIVVHVSGKAVTSSL